jgi:hypothetical protein
MVDFVERVGDLLDPLPCEPILTIAEVEKIDITITGENRHDSSLSSSYESRTLHCL